jgi:hypothetical protein
MTFTYKTWSLVAVAGLAMTTLGTFAYLNTREISTPVPVVLQDVDTNIPQVEPETPSTSIIPSIPRPERLSLNPESAHTHISTYYTNATQDTLAWATAILLGQDLPSNPITAEEITYIHPLESTTQSFGTGKSLLDDALSFDRMDAIVVFLSNNIDPNVMDNAILWSILEQWTPSTHDIHQQALSLYLKNGGEADKMYESSYSSLEMASTISQEAVGQLIEAGANPWVATDGFGPGLLERLTLHSDVPFVLDMIEYIADLTLPTPDTRALENTIGNMVDRFDALAKEGLSVGVTREGVLEGTPDPKILQIARIVMKLTTFENTPWQYVPQEFIDLKEAGLL